MWVGVMGGLNVATDRAPIGMDALLIALAQPYMVGPDVLAPGVSRSRKAEGRGRKGSVNPKNKL